MRKMAQRSLTHFCSNFSVSFFYAEMGQLAVLTKREAFELIRSSGFWSNTSMYHIVYKIATHFSEHNLKFDESRWHFCESIVIFMSHTTIPHQQRQRKKRCDLLQFVYQPCQVCANDKINKTFPSFTMHFCVTMNILLAHFSRWFAATMMQRSFGFQSISMSLFRWLHCITLISDHEICHCSDYVNKSICTFCSE